MNQIQELREKRAKAWDAAKAFLDTKRGTDGLLAAEDVATYEKMEADVVNLGKEIDRLERQAALDAELNKPTADPLTSKPAQPAADQKTGRASDAYKKAFWNAIRSKNPRPEILNSLLEGTDSEGGYLVPDEFEKTLVQKLTAANVLRPLCHVIQTSFGDRKIPVVASKGTAGWVDEEGTYPLSDDTFSQVVLGAYKLATMIKVSEELLSDSVFDIEGYVSDQFGKRIGDKEEDAFLTGNGVSKPIGILHTTGGAEVGVTTAGASAITGDELIDLVYSLRAPYRKGAVFVLNDTTVKLDKMKSNLRAAIGRGTKFKSRSTGKLAASLGVSPAKLDRDNNFDVKVGFSEGRGEVSNAMLANLLEYGKHGQPPKPFLKQTKSSSRKPCIEAMQAMLKEELDIP